MLDSAVGVRSNSAEWAAVLHGKPSPRRLQTITSSGRDHLPCGRRYDFMLHMACTSAGRRDPRRPVAGGTSRAWVCSASLRLDALDVLSVADALDVPRGSPRRHKLHHDDGRAQPQVAQRQHLRRGGWVEEGEQQREDDDGHAQPVDCARVASRQTLLPPSSLLQHADRGSPRDPGVIHMYASCGARGNATKDEVDGRRSVVTKKTVPSVTDATSGRCVRYKLKL